MNDQGREALVQAALRGVRQIRAKFADEHGGRCALGVLADAAGLNPLVEPWSDTERAYGLDLTKQPCALCGFMGTESQTIAHLNDIHELDFLTIARKV